MLTNLFHKIGLGIAAVFHSVAAWFGLQPPDTHITTPIVIPQHLTPQLADEIDLYLENSKNNDKILGSTAPEGTIAGSTYNLSGAGISSSATSINLQSLTITQTGQKILDTDLADTFYITLEPGNRTKQEIVSCTTVVQNANNSATLSGCSRGLAPIPPYTASTTLAFIHAGGSQVIFSDPPQLFEDIIAYINDIAIAGAPNASLTSKGIVEIGTQIETASSTLVGSTGATTAIPTSNATSTYNPATAPLRVVVTQNNGKIDPNFIATSTLYGSSAGTGLASTTFIGSFPAYMIGKNRAIITTTGTTTFSIPSGITSMWAEVLAGGGGGGSCSTGGSNFSGGGGGGAGGYSQEIIDVSATTSIQIYIAASVTAETTGQRSTIGTIGFGEFLSATGGGPGSEGISGAGGVGTGGDINATGAGGGAGRADTTTNSSIAGAGGSSLYGGGGQGQSLNGSTGNGSNAGNYGSGGGGASCGSGGSSTGGTGSQGLAVLRW